MNEFVTYLNSTNNIGGDSVGSLAETQVKSKYYDMIKVDRRLGNYIADSVKSKNFKAFILTGHAGDGKTSILVQVLKNLGYLMAGEALSEEKEYLDFYYVKDLSEVAQEKQPDILEKALSSPNYSRSSLLISNTGPLLRAFTLLEQKRKQKAGLSFSENDQIELQSTLLTQLDINEDKEIEISGYRFLLINIARVDNVEFASQILKRVIEGSLWEKCSKCSCSDKCPIYNNQKLVAKQFDRVSKFVENYYRYLYENDKRMTIRQMLGQLSYAITGNLSCNDVKNKLLKEPFFNYNFANLFFGFYGIDEKKDSNQIKGIEQVRILELDKIALDVDYRLFVNHDFSFFTPEIQHELEGLYSKYRRYYQITDESLSSSSEEKKIEIKLRRAVRRFYLVYSLFDDENGINNLLNQVFGANFTDYCKMVSDKHPKSIIRKLQSAIFQALYIKNTGASPDGQTDLPLTLRREDDVFQNVMLVLGKVSKNALEIVQCPVNNSFEDNMNKQIIFLKIRDDKFKITLPLVNYFHGLISGAISSNNNPALTHGIATLDAMLLDNFGDEAPESEDDCEMRVIINTTSGQEYENFGFSDGNLNVW